MRHHPCTFILIALALSAGCGNQSTGPTGNKAELAVSLTGVTGTRTDVGFSYSLTVHIDNKGSVAATVNNLTIALAAASALGTTTVLNPFTGKVPAAGSMDSRIITVTDDVAGHSYASTISAAVTFTDDAQNTGTETGTATLAPLAACCTMRGTVTETAPTSTTPVVGATITITNGSNTGTTATTDANGQFTFSNVQGTMTLRASAANYDDATQTITMTTDRTDIAFQMAPVVQTRNDTFSDTVAPDSPVCQSFNADGRLPCKEYVLSIHGSEVVEAVLRWDDPNPQSWTLALDLEREPGTGQTDRVAISHFSSGNQEQVSVILPAGAVYTLRVLYQGTLGPQNPQPYTLNVRRGPP